MKAYYSYYNTSLLPLHEYSLNNKSLYELYVLRKKLIDNNNFIVDKVNKNLIDNIEKIITSKINGSLLMKIIKENTILYKQIVNEDNIPINNNFKLLELYKNINKIEKIFNFEKNSLLSKYQLKSRLILRLKYFFYRIKNKLLLCKI